MTVRIIDQLREDNVEGADSCQSSANQPVEYRLGIASFHDGKDRANAFILPESYTNHEYEFLLIERLPVLARIVVVLIDAHTAKHSDHDYHEEDGADGKDKEELEPLDSSNPSYGSEHHDCQYGPYP